MSNDIREKAEAVVKIWEGNGGTHEINNAVIDLKAALRPSREEIADFLEAYWNDEGFNPKQEEREKMFNYTIEELRRKD